VVVACESTLCSGRTVEHLASEQSCEVTRDSSSIILHLATPLWCIKRDLKLCFCELWCLPRQVGWREKSPLLGMTLFRELYTGERKRGGKKATETIRLWASEEIRGEDASRG